MRQESGEGRQPGNKANIPSENDIATLSTTDVLVTHITVRVGCLSTPPHLNLWEVSQELPGRDHTHPLQLPPHDYCPAGRSAPGGGHKTEL